MTAECLRYKGLDDEVNLYRTTARYMSKTLILLGFLTLSPAGNPSPSALRHPIFGTEWRHQGAHYLCNFGLPPGVVCIDRQAARSLRLGMASDRFEGGFQVVRKAVFCHFI